jgi:hypothetical protein
MERKREIEEKGNMRTGKDSEREEEGEREDDGNM